MLLILCLIYRWQLPAAASLADPAGANANANANAR